MKTRFIFEKCGCCIPFSKTEIKSIKIGKKTTYHRVCIEHGNSIVKKQVTCDKCLAVLDVNKKCHQKKCPICGFTITAVNESVPKKKKSKGIIFEVKKCIICGEDINNNYEDGMCTKCHLEDTNDVDLLIYNSFCKTVCLNLKSN